MKFVLPVCFLILSIVQFSYSQSAAEAVVNSFIAKQAKSEKAEEYADARKILRGDVNKDGKEDLVVLYTLEGFGGGNLYIQYLAVFTGNGKNFRYAANKSVGGKNNRSIELNSIKNGTIYLETLKYLPNDPSCCPSKKGKTKFVFSQDKLKEI